MMTTILVVDDEVDLESLLTGWFRRQVRQGQYQFHFARNGLEALALLRAEPGIDIVLLDINMPEMDGLTLLGELPALNPLLRAVMVSAYGDMDNIRAAMNQGAFDFVCKPINFTDLTVTIEKTAEHVRQLRESHQLKVIDELKTRFFDNITHEFRTPLTLILSPVERLLQDYQDDALRRGLQLVERNARQLLRLINQLLDLTKLEAGYLTLSPGAGDLGDFVGQIVQVFANLAEERGLQLTYHTDLTGFYLFDAEKIEQIVYNLIANAIKFTPAGRVSVRLTAGLPADSPAVTPGADAKTGEALNAEPAVVNGSRSDSGVLPVRLVVADTGIGIAPEKLPHIFNRFYQVAPGAGAGLPLNEPALTYTHPGTGIGLALVKELTELMGGRVTVSSSGRQPINHPAVAQTGTTFTVELPLQPAVNVGLDEPPLSYRPAGVATVRAVPTKLAGDWPSSDDQAEDRPLVLVVDDNDELRAFVAGELASRYRVLTAANGQEGWQVAKAELPDLVLSDVVMPGMDGYTLTQHLKNDSATDHIAVVLLTAKAAPPSRIEGLQQGADDYLTKPFPIAELHLRLHNLLTRQQTLRTYYHKQFANPEIPFQPETVTDKFLLRANELLEAHLDDSRFGVEEFAHGIGMSRRTLHRKLTAVANLTTNDFIRQYRLKRGAELLRKGHNVSETAYRVGYESPAYFTTVFKEFYQKTPTEFMRQ